MVVWPIKPGENVLPSSPDDTASAPGVLYALGLIVVYFLLQVVAGAAVSLVVGWLEKSRHPNLSQAQVHEHVMTLLQRPDSNALLVILTLPVIVLLMLWFVYRTWPALWARPHSPGFGLTTPSSASWYPVALLIGLAMPPLGALLTQLLAHGHAVTQNVEELSRHASGNLHLPLAIIAVTVGPIIEEVMFRGVLLSALMHRLSTRWSVVICAALFGAVHLGGLDFQWYAVPNLILLAVALCWLRLKSASLWPAILTHGVYNLFALIALFAAT
ncbi:type II CAAX endopeptidase family protein [Dyella sp. M7H15-1]|uniref:CPBP family intramembrane glutamic endopeptidase n=1 Tax=Dyella sp. M7H15-1 TaxID=2501295 RepID=UPI0013E8F26B|nr:type II CAAX endopeptidase family protein [Dyella sp. M7H15-1]